VCYHLWPTLGGMWNRHPVNRRPQSATKDIRKEGRGYSVVTNRPILWRAILDPVLPQ